MRGQCGSSTTDIIPALGLSWANLVTTRLMLTRTHFYVKRPHMLSHHSQSNIFRQSASSKNSDETNVYGDTARKTIECNVRTLQVMFCPWLERKSCSFIVTERGIEDAAEFAGCV